MAVEHVYQDPNSGLDMTETSVSSEIRYEVDCALPQDSEFDVITALGTGTTPDRLPKRGDPHPKDTKSLLRANTYRIRRIGDCTFEVVWRFDLIHNSIQGQKGTDAEFGDPLKAPVEVKTRCLYDMEPIDTDYYGRPICNSAGEPFDPPPQGRKYRWEIHAWRNALQFNEVWYQAYLGATNSDIFRLKGQNYDRTFPSLTVLCETIEPEPISYGTGTFYRIHHVFTVMIVRTYLQGWRLRILDQGLKQLNTARTASENIVDAQGRPIASPVRLRNGRPLGPNDDPAWLFFSDKPELPFANLGLSGE